MKARSVLFLDIEKNLTIIYKFISLVFPNKPSLFLS